MSINTAEMRAALLREAAQRKEKKEIKRMAYLRARDRANDAGEHLSEVRFFPSLPLPRCDTKQTDTKATDDDTRRALPIGRLDTYHL